MREQILERLRWAYKRSPRVVRKTLTPLRDKRGLLLSASQLLSRKTSSVEIRGAAVAI